MAQNTLHVEVPGKVILFGEHAVVYPGNQAVLWPVRSLRARVAVNELETHNNDSYELTDTGALRTTVIFNDIDKILSEGRFTHQKYDTSGDISLLSMYKDSPQYLEFCCALAHEHVSSKKTPKALQLRIDSNIPIGGFGSSAAIAAAIIKAIVSANDLVLDQRTWFQLVMQAEKLQHGNPSGGDPAIATMRTPIIVAKRADGTLDIEQIEETPTVQAVIADTQLIYTGKPQQTTGVTVQYVASHVASKEILQNIEHNTQRAIKLIKSNQITPELWKELVNTNGELLEHLGVVPEKFVHISKEIRKTGGAIKISGGGATRGDAAGVFLSYDARQDLNGEYIRFSLV